MSRMTRVGLLAGTAALTVTGVSVASPATEASSEQLRAQINQLTARVAELEGRQQNSWLTEQRAEEVRSIVQDVLADADTRASLLGSGMAAGYDNGFHLGSADGNYMLRINGQLQTRWIYSYQSDGAGDDGDRHRSGFENSRAKLWFTGHIVNPQWGYHIETGFNDGDGDWGLLDAYLSYDYGDGISWTIGQFKAPLLREELVDSRYQQTVERSILNEIFTGGRTQGVMLTFQQEMFRIMASWNEGAEQANTSWDTGPGPALVGSTEYSLTGRAEFLIQGNWDQFKEFRSAPGEETGIMAGAAVHWQKDEYGTAFSPETRFVVLTGDVSAKLGGANLFGAINYANVKPTGGSSEDIWGFVVQGGMHFTDELEGFVRYEWADLDSLHDLSILTWGVNYYFAGHNAKLTADMGYSFKQLEVLGTDLADGTRAGWRADDDKGQFVVRTQLQLAF